MTFDIWFVNKYQEKVEFVSEKNWANWGEKQNEYRPVFGAGLMLRFEFKVFDFNWRHVGTTRLPVGIVWLIIIIFVTFKFFFFFLQNSIVLCTHNTHEDFDCLKLEICKSNTDISFSCMYVYSDSTSSIRYIWLTYLQFYAVKIAHNYA